MNWTELVQDKRWIFVNAVMATALQNSQVMFQYNGKRSSGMLVIYCSSWRRIWILADDSARIATTLYAFHMR